MPALTFERLACDASIHAHAPCARVVVQKEGGWCRVLAGLPFHRLAWSFAPMNRVVALDYYLGQCSHILL